ncbi:hypothetical protein GQ55_5G214500 [Panicum hallii var. hallii]|uniref:Uncharacterized protein n=1 Tax=Panicum hallii var. hallii TaxID=1504633 RepID=A0A2T7DIS1_9POAL|nr:hypothetical protein GQ55_5G214500 [Panicum hallii var. hallii]
MRLCHSDPCALRHPLAKLIKLVKSSYLFIKNLTIVALSAVKRYKFFPIIHSQYITKQIFSSAFNDLHRNQLNKNTLDLILQARFTCHRRRTDTINSILAFCLLVIIVSGVVGHRHHRFQVVLRLAKISILASIPLLNSICHVFLRIDQSAVAAGDGPSPLLLPRLHEIHAFEVTQMIFLWR